MKEPSIEVFHTCRGTRIYRILLDIFPGFQGYAHVLFLKDVVALIDVGSGFGDCNEQLEAGLDEIRTNYGEIAHWDNLTHILISHAHIDHYGGLSFVQSRCQAPIGIHLLDRRVLTCYEDQLTIVAHKLHTFLIEAGVSPEREKRLMDLYLINKHLFKSIPVNFTFNEVGMKIGSISIIHVPGHCPGQVIFQVDDILLSGDHILQETSPHQSPEQLTSNTGLGHYLESLEKTRPISHSINWVLGGHEDPFTDLEARINAIEQLHQDRLNQILKLLCVSMTLTEISDQLFPDTHGYHELLALEETGAHLEYLHQRGYIYIDNLESAIEDGSAPFYYRQLENIFATETNLNEIILQDVRRGEKV